MEADPKLPPASVLATATGQAGKKRPQATAQEDAGTEELDKDEEEGEEGAKYSDTEESGPEEEPAPQAIKLLRQLRGASKVEEVERSSEVERKSTVVNTRHNFYKQTKVTSHAQEEQSALPAGVINVCEDTDDEGDYAGEQKEIAKGDAGAPRGAAARPRRRRGAGRLPLRVGRRLGARRRAQDAFCKSFHILHVYMAAFWTQRIDFYVGF